ncbi:MAG: TonB-dependent receptor, partial [Spirochaetota bacterium]
EVETQGCELYTLINLPFDLSISGNYTYTKTEDKVKKEELLRRPKHQWSIVFNWTILKKADLNIVYNYVGRRNDISFDSFYNPTIYRMDSYSTVDLKLSFWVTPNIQVYGRVENMMDMDYQQVNGYAMPGLAFYAGIQGQIL